MKWGLDIQDKAKERAQNSQEVYGRIYHAFQAKAEKRFEIEEHINYWFIRLRRKVKKRTYATSQSYHFASFAGNRLD